MLKSKKILLGITGSISAYKAVQLISDWRKEGHEVKVAATPSALKFIGEATLEGISGQQIFKDEFQPGKIMDHIQLVNWCDMMIICPATAQTINSLSRGLSTQVVTSLGLAWDFRKPAFIIPAMNSKMWLHPATQESVERLEIWGWKFLNPESGSLACGEVGPGRLPSIEEIHKFVFLENSTPRPKVIVTAGGTREWIDGVRCISNTSSGRTGVQIASEFLDLGFEVDLLLSEQSVYEPSNKINLTRFSDSSDLENKLKHLLKSHFYSTCIHLAAVSDYSVDEIAIGNEVFTPDKELKLSSGHSEIQVTLKKRSKIINGIKSWSLNKDLILIGFKLTKKVTSTKINEVISKLLSDSKADLVVHNDLESIEKRNHQVNLFGKDGFSVWSGPVDGLSQNLIQFLNLKQNESGVSHDLVP